MSRIIKTPLDGTEVINFVGTTLDQNSGSTTVQDIADLAGTSQVQSNNTQAIPYTGVEVPANPGVNIGDTHTDEFNDGTIVFYTWDGTDWVVGFVDSVSTAQRPWIKVGNTNETSATDVLKTDDVYHMGSVGIGQVAPARILDVNGDALVNGLTVGRGAGNISTNTALGYQALDSNTTGEYSVAIGESALKNNTTGLSNTAIGYQALFSNTTGYNNNAIGLYALYSNTTGYENIANGFYSLHGNTVGFNNISIGFRAMQVNTTGSRNVAIGVSAGRYITGGASNQTSSNSLYLGHTTRASADGNTNEIVVGYNAIGGGSNTATIGNSSVTVLYLAGAVGWFQGNGTPEGAVTAPVGSFYSRKDGGAGTSFYVKESGGSTVNGWVGK